MLRLVKKTSDLPKKRPIRKKNVRSLEKSSDWARKCSDLPENDPIGQKLIRLVEKSSRLFEKSFD